MKFGSREIDTSKDLYTIDDLDELRDYLNAFFCEISKFHPNYPEYGYTYEDGKIIECRLKDMCQGCQLNKNCPCGYSAGNAACLTLREANKPE